MTEPWLDSLSEDWDSQPTSTSPSAPASSGRVLEAQQQQQPSPSKPSSVDDGFLSGASMSNMKTNHDRALLEQSYSAINIAPYSLDAGSDETSVPPPLKSSVPSLISENSVRRHAPSILHRSRSSSPPKSKRSTETPEWKRLVKLGARGTMAQNDLFSPLGLEGIFHTPHAKVSTTTSRVGPGLYNLHDNEVVPSSPPPWPKNHRASLFTFKHLGAYSAKSEADAMDENNQERLKEEAILSDLPQKHGISSIFQDSVSLNGSIGVLSADQANESAQSQRSTNGEQAPLARETFFPTMEAPPKHAAFAGIHGIAQSEENSSLSGLSPVFVSKHQTAEGGVNYSALDMSNYRIVEQMKDFRTLKPDRSTASNESPSNIASVPATIGNLESDGGSQTAVAMSSPNSSSIVPSDSVSQVCPDRNSNVPSHTPVIRHEGLEHAVSAVKDPILHTPPQSPARDAQLINSKRTPGSPLKLFADHDTFTNGRLLSRLTQLDGLDQYEDDGAATLYHDLSAVYGGRYCDIGQHTNSAQESNVSIESTLPCDETTVPRTMLGEIRASRPDSPSIQSQAEDPRYARAEGIGRNIISNAPVEREFQLEPGQAKRAAPSPFKQPTPKRQRTLVQLECAPVVEDVSHPVEEQDYQMQVDERKHEPGPVVQDDRTGLGIKDSESETSRPRDLILTQAQCQSRSTSSSMSHSFSGGDPLSSVYAHIEQTPVSCHPEDVSKIGAVASKVAAIQFSGVESTHGSIRKQSVSTQDYVNEAMKIMDIIRSNRIVHDDLIVRGVSDQGGMSSARDEGWVMTPTTISRPPSRDGGKNAWRSQHDEHLDSRVISHLKKYQETGDDSFGVSSALHFAEVIDCGSDDATYEKREGQAGDFEVQVSILSEDIYYGGNGTTRIENDERTSRSGNIRITERRFPDRESGNGQSPVKTHVSNPSTDSSGRTVQTESTQKTRTVPVILPGKVSHLISDIETAVGMRFDRERQSWVRDRTLSSQHYRAMNYSSSTGTEDDPFGHIPDLSVNDMSGLVCDLTEVNSTHNDAITGINGPITTAVRSDSASGSFEIMRRSSGKPSDWVTLEQFQEESGSAVDVTRPGPWVRIIQPSGSLNKEQEATTEVHPNKKQSTPFPVHDIPANTVGLSVGKRHSEAGEDLILLKDKPIYGTAKKHDFMAPERASRPTDCTSDRKRPMFSSPPVSREYPSLAWHENTEYSFDSEDEWDDALELKPIRNGIRSGLSYAEDPRLSRASVSSTRPGQFSEVNAHRTMSISRIDEHHEISFIGSRPDGRSLSFAFSVSTPLPAHRNALRSRIPCNDLQSNLFLQSLSPLSEFTIHQDDARHLKVRNLLQTQQLSIPDRSIKSAGVVDQLVTKLTDVEPDEPFWDALRTLRLNCKQLNHLHTLVEFCPSLEELDVSDNHLQHLGGIPSTVRHLNLRNNCLSSLTTWEHLINLQHLDLSNNAVEHIDGLGSLLHLRDLNVDNNHLTCLEGVFDLDSLLQLSARGNKLSNLDFQSADLRRLVKLDIAYNDLHIVGGLQCLPSLRDLVLDHNNLRVFPFPDSHHDNLFNLSSLRVAHNSLCELDVLPLPNLRFLDADNNSLRTIRNISQLKDLQTLKLRNQTSLDGCLETPEALEQFHELRNLFLSGNSIRGFPITVQFLSLQILELAFTGLQSLPANFGALVPNLRVLNLNCNALKDLRPLRGISRLKRLFVAANRLSRLRKTLRVITQFEVLEELDMRNNPFSLSFYPPTSHAALASELQVMKTWLQDGFSDVGVEDLELQHKFGPAQHLKDVAHVERLDEETRLRRKVYELLLAVKCKSLQEVDGLHWDVGAKTAKDGVWEKLLGFGVVEKVTDEAGDDGRKDSITQGGQTEAIMG